MKRAREEDNKDEAIRPLGDLDAIDSVFVDVMKGAEVFDRWDWTLLSYVCKTFRSMIVSRGIPATSLAEALVVLGTPTSLIDPCVNALKYPLTVVSIWKAFVRRPRTDNIHIPWRLLLQEWETKMMIYVESFLQWCLYHLEPEGVSGFQWLLEKCLLTTHAFCPGESLWSYATGTLRDFGKRHLFHALGNGSPTFLAQLKKLVTDEDSLGSFELLDEIINDKGWTLVEKLVCFNPRLLPVLCSYNEPEVIQCYFKLAVTVQVDDFVDALIFEDEPYADDLEWLRATIQHQKQTVIERISLHRHDHDEDADNPENQSFEDALLHPLVRAVLEEHGLLKHE